MSSVTYRCPHCENSVRRDLGSSPTTLECPACSHQLSVPEGSITPDRIDCCAICGGDDLFVRKDFPQRLGVTIVIIGFAISCLTWYHRMIIPTFGVLFATALVDVLLFALMGDVVECYRCHAHYRGLGQPRSHGAFDLEVHERHRQQESRLGESSAHRPAGVSREG